METLQQLTRRQLDALRTVQECEKEDRGASLTEIAAALKVSPPSALGHLTPLEGLGLIQRHRGKTRLTAKGRSTLVEYLRHHRVTERVFNQLGFSPDESCSAAREVDLAISHHTVDKLCEVGGHPSTCAHGEPIPPCDAKRNRRGRSAPN